MVCPITQGDHKQDENIMVCPITQGDHKKHDFDINSQFAVRLDLEQLVLPEGDGCDEAFDTTVVIRMVSHTSAAYQIQRARFLLQSSSMELCTG